MDAVREFRREDVQPVAALWLRTFHPGHPHPSRTLHDYFRDIFFESPWADPELPSLVYEERGRGIAGFLGVMPRRMTFRGKPVRAAVATQLAVDSRARGYPAAKLMKRFLAGKQDISFSDGANDESERLWRACGGDVASFHSLAWTRVLRPARYAGVLLAERKGAAALIAGLASPIAWAADAMAARTPQGVRWLPRQPELSILEDPPADAFLWCIQKLAGNRSLMPAYDPQTLHWLVKRAGERKRFGPLRRAIVRDAGGQTAGWYLYYSNPGRVAQVLQFGARPDRVSQVLNCLFHEARRHGAVAVSGGMETRFTKEIASGRCGFAWPGYAVVVHSRNTEILNAVHRGDAFLTRLEGEWWARFSDAEWEPEKPGPWKRLAESAWAQPEINLLERGERT